MGVRYVVGSDEDGERSCSEACEICDGAHVEWDASAAGAVLVPE